MPGAALRNVVKVQLADGHQLQEVIPHSRADGAEQTDLTLLDTFSRSIFPIGLHYIRPAIGPGSGNASPSSALSTTNADCDTHKRCSPCRSRCGF